MKLDRNTERNKGRGKYALIKCRDLAAFREPGINLLLPVDIYDAIKTLENAGVLDWGEVGSDGEFFVIRLKDKYAQTALYAYADAADEDDEEWAHEVGEMAARSGPAHPNCKRPD